MQDMWRGKWNSSLQLHASLIPTITKFWMELVVFKRMSFDRVAVRKKVNFYNKWIFPVNAFWENLRSLTCFPRNFSCVIYLLSTHQIINNLKKPHEEIRAQVEQINLDFQHNVRNKIYMKPIMILPFKNIYEFQLKNLNLTWSNFFLKTIK